MVPASVMTAVVGQAKIRKRVTAFGESFVRAEQTTANWLSLSSH